MRPLPQRQKQATRLKKVVSISVTLLALALIGYGVWGLWQRYVATHQPAPTIANEIVTTDVDQPAETKPTEACDDWRVADDLPRKIELPSLGVSGCVQRVGLTEEGAIAVPTNIHLAGWYVDSARPGESGVSLIDGHVLGRYDDAIFARLDELKPGEIIRIEMGNSEVREFEMVDSAAYKIAEATRHLFAPLDGVSNQLNLITCTGQYLKDAETYDKRLVVRARLID